MIVVDASVLATALTDDGRSGDAARARLRNERLVAPEVIDLEVASALRSQLRSKKINVRRAALALSDLADVHLDRAPHRPLLPRCWELRNNLTIYDAAYIALAEMLEVPFLTSDRRLSRSPNLRCVVEVISTPPAELPDGF